MPIVVCSRVTDYKKSTIRLKFDNAIVLLELTSEQISEYIESGGESFAMVRNVIKNDPSFQELAKSPLMLNLMAATYQDVAGESLKTIKSVDESRKHLFDAYVQRMLKHRPKAKRYSHLKTIKWLSWLAHLMDNHSQSVLLIERIQPTWLHSKMLRFIFVLIVSLIAATSIWSPFSFALRLERFNPGKVNLGVSEPTILVIFFFLLVMAAAEASGDIKLVEKLHWSFKKILLGTLLGICTIAVLSTINTLLGGALVTKAQKDLQSILASVMYVGTLIKLTLRIRNRAKDGKAISLHLGIVTLLFIGIIVWTANYKMPAYPLDFFITDLRGSVGFGLIVGLGWGLRWGFSYNSLDAKMAVNQGIRQSARNAILMSFLFVTIAGLYLLFFDVRFKGYDLYIDPIKRLSLTDEYGLVQGAMLLLTISAVGAMVLGGYTCIKHYTLRLFLHSLDRIPWRLPAFLDYAVDRVFMRRVGGGYIFIHRLMLEYFSSLRSQEEDSINARISQLHKDQAVARSEATFLCPVCKNMLPVDEFEIDPLTKIVYCTTCASEMPSETSEKIITQSKT